MWWVQDDGSRSLPMDNLPHGLVPGRRAEGIGGWWVPLLEGVAVLHRAAPPGASSSAQLWQRLLHLTLQLVAARLVYPALDTEGRAVWRVGPIPTAAEQALTALTTAAPPSLTPPGTSARQLLTACRDAVADTLVRTPAAAMLSDGPWTTPAPHPVDAHTAAATRAWLDAVEEHVDGGPAPEILLRVQLPAEHQTAADQLRADLYLAPDPSRPGNADAAETPAHEVWSGTTTLAGDTAHSILPRVRRALRRAAPLCPALAHLADQPAPSTLPMSSDTIEALLQHEDELARAGVRVLWPQRIRTALTTAAVIGTTDSSTRPGEEPRFALTSLLDFRWQIALDGTPLTALEMDALAEAARPLVRIRGHWVLADPTLRRRARERLLGQLPGTQALTAALAGRVTVADELVPCVATGALADVISVLRHQEHHHDTATLPSGLHATLRDYQHRALTWLAHTTRLGFGAVLADDMGLGKTITALAFTLHHQERSPGPTLVVCPASLVTTWCREAARFAPDLPVVAYHGPDRTLETVTDTTVVVTTYGLLRRDQAQLASRTWALVIADEAQHAKNHTSATARNLRAIPATTRLALSGTPVENDLSELWALLDWTNPALFGTLKKFRARWATAAEKDPGGAAAVELAQVIRPFLLRRLKTDPGIAPELPPKIVRPCLVRLTTEQAGLYEAVVRETLQQIEASRGIARHGLVFKLLNALKKIANHPAHFLGEKPPTSREAAAFAPRSGKAAALTELLETLTAQDEAALVFTSYVTMGRLLAAHLTHLGYEPLFLHGATPPAERQRMVDAFQSGRHPAMVLSLKAAGTGLTLTRATHVIHYDRPWNAAPEDQASDRAHRIGQQQTVTVHQMITEHTVEDRIDELLTRKRALAQAVLTSGEQALTQLTDRELAALVHLGSH
ncbi:DEAD/DEAH box helicase [Streptomyces xiamenensis]